MSTPSPSWYDLLGLSPDATEDEVRTRWRDAIADLDPTDRRFGVLNRAAGVLLDPIARAAYDAELAAAEPEPEPEPERAVEPEDLVVTAGEATPDRARRVVPGWVLAGVGALTLVVAGAAAVVAATIPSDQSLEDASAAARSAAERAIVPVLSYDAAHLDQSQAAARPYLTGDYRKEYDKLFDGAIAENAPATGTVLKATVLRSGIARADEHRARVFLLVDQTRTNKASKRPVVYQNWVTVTMENVDGEWLIADLKT